MSAMSSRSHDSGASSRVAQALTVRARDRQSAFIDVVEGIDYVFTARGWWVDFYIPCGADGYDAWWLRDYEKSRIIPGANWFALIAIWERGEGDAFVVGRHLPWHASRSGRLALCANDIPAMYWNNWGSLEVSLAETRLRRIVAQGMPRPTTRLRTGGSSR